MFLDEFNAFIKIEVVKRGFNKVFIRARNNKCGFNNAEIEMHLK